MVKPPSTRRVRVEPSSVTLKYFTWASLALSAAVGAGCLVLVHVRKVQQAFLLFKTATALTDVVGHLLFALVLLEVGADTHTDTYTHTHT